MRFMDPVKLSFCIFFHSLLFWVKYVYCIVFMWLHLSNHNYRPISVECVRASKLKMNASTHKCNSIDWCYMRSSEIFCKSIINDKCPRSMHHNIQNCFAFYSVHVHTTPHYTCRRPQISSVDFRF